MDQVKWMPIMRTGLAIRMDLLDERQAKINHGQTLDRLAERGGLSASEALAICEKREWRRVSAKDALVSLQALSEGR
jgi:predicted RNA-binding Zn ribbon-like protein